MIPAPLLGTVAGRLSESSSTENFVSFDVPLWAWVALLAVITAMLLVDVLVVHRVPHEISFKEAAIESAVWIAIGLSFTFVMLAWHGGPAAGEYLSGYLIEKSLSIDNVFVWAVIFSYFAVPKMFQFRVLFWGIFGALVLRAFFIFAGVALLERFDWILYVFGAFLLYSAWKIATHDDEEVHPEKNPMLKLINRVVPTTPDYDGQKLFTRRTGVRLATPLFAVLVLIETTDVIFAFDSIPAILAVSREPFIVFSSNAFAILGLRALYFCLSGIKDKFRYLNQGLGVILAFVGLKMLAADLYHVPTWASLAFIALVLTTAILLSIRADNREDAAGGIDGGAAGDGPDGGIAASATDGPTEPDRGP
ncbi:MAG: TerC family protein [Acidimicrobiales bacterium]|nr:TerC family protein [Acidimicrobiales bacterium]